MKQGDGLTEDFALIHDGERILETGRWPELKNNFSGKVVDLGDRTMVPGLINAHVHLELSHLTGKTVQGLGFTSWVKSLLANPLYELDEQAVRNALISMRESGTCFCVDISTRNCASIASLMDEQSMGFYACCEAIGLHVPKKMQHSFPTGSSGTDGLQPQDTHSIPPLRNSLRRSKRPTAGRGCPSLFIWRKTRKKTKSWPGAAEFCGDAQRSRYACRLRQPGSKPGRIR